MAPLKAAASSRGGWLAPCRPKVSGGRVPRWRRNGRPRPSPACPHPADRAYGRGPRTRPCASLAGGTRRAQGRKRESRDLALCAHVRHYEPAVTVDWQVGQADCEVPALPQHPLAAAVEDLWGLPDSAGERVHDDRYVPRDTAIDPIGEEIGQLRSQLPGDLLWDVGGGYQPQPHHPGLGPRGRGGWRSFLASRTPLTGHCYPLPVVAARFVRVRA